MSTHKWHLSAKDVVLALLQFRVKLVEHPVVFSERLLKPYGLVLNQNLHENRACQNLRFLTILAT